MTVSGPAMATTGGTHGITLAWSGLAAGQKYLGTIRYLEGDTAHATTFVRIDP
jgi:hypothetical protein